jgi:hypothetical protein
MKLPNEEVFRPLNNRSFTLNPGEERFFHVAYRHDYAVRTNEVNSIQFSIPAHGGEFLSGESNWVPKGTYFITLKAEAFEAKAYELKRKLWVDENGRLRLERLDNAA